MSVRRRVSTMSAATIVALWSTPIHAQIFIGGAERPAGAWSFTIGGAVANPVGEFATQVEHAWGGGASAAYHSRRMPMLGLRADVTMLNYGNERKRVPLSPTVNRVVVDMRTSNNIAVFSGGPELAFPRGLVRPYAFGFVGYSTFFTESSVDDDNGGSFASSTNFSDGGLAAGWGAGVRVPFRARSASLAIDAGARFTHNGSRSYLRRGDIIDLPDGSLQFNARRSATDFVQFQLGVSITPYRRR